jgi:large subunit ribosomal protein L33
LYEGILRTQVPQDRVQVGSLSRVSAAQRISAMPRETVTLACTVCKERNYTVTKNKRTHPDRVEVRKFCPKCQKHVLHRESR